MLSLNVFLKLFRESEKLLTCFVRAIISSWSTICPSDSLVSSITKEWFEMIIFTLLAWKWSSYELCLLKEALIMSLLSTRVFNGDPGCHTVSGITKLFLVDRSLSSACKNPPEFSRKNLCSSSPVVSVWIDLSFSYNRVNCCLWLMTRFKKKTMRDVYFYNEAQSKKKHKNVKWSIIVKVTERDTINKKCKFRWKRFPYFFQ